MERHIAKRLGIPCAVISAPVHVQDFPARHSPQMGYEGANVLFDTWVHPLMMGLEEHLLAMFRHDFEFHDGAAPSHLGHGHAAGKAAQAATPAQAPGADAVVTVAASQPVDTAPAPTHGTGNVGISTGAANDAITRWAPEAERELGKIPFFVRGKARRNTERFAAERGVQMITVETLYDAKAHFGR
jgi:light-independent protochlorophyllide reductase subunit B